MQKFVFILAFLLLASGCSERYGGPIFPQPHIPSESPAALSEERVILDLAQEYDFVDSEVVNEVHSVASHTFIVELDDGTFIKIVYYHLDGSWVYISEQVEL